MAGASKAHNLLANNFMRKAWDALQGRKYQVFTSDVRVVLEENNHYVYPDVVVSCDPDDQRDDYQLRKPLLIVEVLSASTASYDRPDKFQHYKKLPSLRYYVLVYQERWLVEWYHKNEAGEWVHHLLDGPDDVLEIAELNLRLSLADLYAATTIAPLRRLPPPSGDQPR